MGQTIQIWGVHTHPLFRRLSILKIEEIHKFQVACFIYKVYKGLMSPYLSAMFCLNETIHPHGTRHANDFHIVVHRTSLLKSTIRIAGPVLWNCLDAKLKSSKSIYSFRRKYKKYCWFNSLVFLLCNMYDMHVYG